MRHLGALAATLPLIGCAQLPLPVAEFKDSAAFSEASTKELPFGTTQTFVAVRAAFLAYYNLYTKEADTKRAYAQRASETGFYSAVVGVLGGIGKSVEIAAGGAVVGAGAGLFGDRYRLSVQAHNYELAAASLRCMYQLLPGASDANLKAYRFASSGRQANDEVREIALAGLMNVRDKLRTLQTSFEFGQADPNKIKQAIEQQPSTITADNALVAKNLTDFSPAPPAQDVEKYRKDVKTCEALMGA